MSRKMIRLKGYITGIWCLFAVSICHSATLDEQRIAFLNAENALQAGNHPKFKQWLAPLTDYPLFTYLRYKGLSKNLSEKSAIESFLDESADSRYALFLRKRFLKYLARKKKWSDFIWNYHAMSDASLQCSYYWALYQVGRVREAFDGAESLWHVGHSQADQCDPLFFEWMQSPKFNQNFVWQRIGLLMADGNVRLTKYLKRFLPGAEQKLVDFWLSVHRHPKTVLSCAKWNMSEFHHGQIFAHGIERFTKSNPVSAKSVWDARNHQFTIEQTIRDRVEKRIALALAFRRHQDASARLAAIDSNKADETIRSWGVRSNLDGSDWRSVVVALDRLSDQEIETPRWQYWRARALGSLGYEQEALERFSKLAQDRSYFGFMAADRLNIAYKFSDRPIVIDASEIRELEQNTSIQAVSEFLHFKREWDARSEWRHALNDADRHGFLVAAKLAQKWKWDPIAIFTVAKARHWDDLNLRFPLAFDTQISNYADKQQIEPALVYGLIRRESAFDKQARSPVGARGLMQIMPNTGRNIARLLNEKWKSGTALYDPDLNLRYGTTYFKKMFERFNGNFVLAAAAYNAGPHRVDRWLPRDKSVPADVWIESIPFSETRQYVGSVLAYAVIYQHRLKKIPLRITDYMPDIDIGSPTRTEPSHKHLTKTSAWTQCTL